MARALHWLTVGREPRKEHVATRKENRWLYGADPYSADAQKFRSDVAEERVTAPTAPTATAPTNGATARRSRTLRGKRPVDVV